MTGTAATAEQRNDFGCSARAAGLDVAAVVAFVAIGRRNHDLEPGLSGVLGGAAPFLIALVAAWVTLRAWRRPISVTIGVGIWLITATGGLALRVTAFGDTAATAFVLVTLGTTAVLLIGWRVATLAMSRASRSAQP